MTEPAPAVTRSAPGEPEPRPAELFLRGPDGRLSLRAGRCGCCGRVSIPLDRYGCPACGAEAEMVAEEPSPGRGRLTGFVTVHQALTPERPAPFVVGNVRLADGPFLTVVLDVPDEAGLRVGEEMVARPVTRPVAIGDGASGDAPEIVEWLFAPVGEDGR